MNKKIIIVVTVLVAAMFVINPFDGKDKVGKKPLNVYNNLDGFDTGGNDTDAIEKKTVPAKEEDEVIPTEIPKNIKDAGVVRVIESDEDTGAVTGLNSDGDVIIVNDKALEIAENTLTDEEMQKIVDDALEGVINPIESDKKGTDKKEVTPTEKPKADKTESDKPKKNQTEKADTVKNTSGEVDEVTQALFDEMGWDTDAADSPGIPTDAVWTIDNPDANYDGTFSTP